MSKAARLVYVAGRGLACSLGDTLDECVAQLARPQAPARRVVCGELGEFPMFGLHCPATGAAEDWYAQAHALIQRVGNEAGLTQHPDTPLFIASSSINIGALERGARWQHSCAFAEVEHFAAALAWRGPVYWVNTACTSSLNAILAARSLIAEGICDDAMVLGLELPNDFTQHGFAAMQLLSRESPRPLGAERNGLMLSEAVAALHLSAQPACWQIEGGASVVDGADPTGASISAIKRCWQHSLAGKAVDLIKLQASGSPLNDQKEIAALEQLALPAAPALLSLKAAMGHSLGASGAAELALLSAALEAGIWPQTAYPLDATLSQTLGTQAPAQTRRALLSIIGFGGSHAALSLSRDETADAPGTTVTAHEYAVIARHTSAPPADWQSALHVMLSERPRRLGSWIELGLWGALSCLRAAGIEQLADNTLIRIATLDGPRRAIEKALGESLDSGTPMPFSFLQSQPAQLLANLAKALRWQGDARLVTHTDPATLIQLALCEARRDGQDVLLGWLDEETPEVPSQSRWLLLRAQVDTADWHAVNAATDLWSVRGFRLAGKSLQHC